MPKLVYPKKGEPLRAEWGRAVVDAINALMDGPPVSAPLTKQDGTICLLQDYQIWNAITTGTITARASVSGSQVWGSGPAKFLTSDANGVESTMGGFPDFTAWNYFGASISSGIRIQVSWTYDKFVILGGDCSGVP